MTTLEGKLASMNSFEAIKYVLNDIELHDLQCIDIMKMIASKKSLVSYMTGLGKTVLAVGVMQLLWNEDPTRKFIFFGTHDQLTQTPKKIESMCQKRVVVSSGVAKDVNALINTAINSYDVMFVTHDCLLSDKFMNFLFKNREKFCGVFIDEAHVLSNVQGAMSASIVASMSCQFEYFYALTATPITTNVAQLAKLAHVVNKDKYPNISDFSHQIKHGYFSISEEPCFFINRTREDFNSKADYHGIVEFVKPLPYQKDCGGGYRMFELCKGDGAIPQVQKLLEIIKNHRGKRGLIYVNQHSVREWILPFLKNAGITFDCVNSKTKMKERADIMHRFNEEQSLDVVITSVTTALDLDCDYVVFYEFTVEVKQMIGRAHRGLGDKEMDVIFVITEDSPEIDYFYNNVFSISMEIQGILGQSFNELEQVHQVLVYNGYA